MLHDLEIQNLNSQSLTTADIVEQHYLSITKATALTTNKKLIQTVRACLIISPRLAIVDFRNVTAFRFDNKTIKFDFHRQLKQVN